VKVTALDIPGVLLIEPALFRDPRGLFCETYHAEPYAEAGLTERFVQDNVSRSIRGTLRGLHYQEPHAQGKLAMVVEGAVFDVVVDIRKGSPTFGKWRGFELSSDNFRQLYIPPGPAAPTDSA
jgi:dTDP-4-dehydrorhamnose 3,5-epimerase